ncbi:MAG: TetR/AcrR family transcriptional regulator [Prolixibacteraceae bacterium]|nr:TetR/AcrR family transcriptional regulator [Prolixibacteraceae bacterium]
METNKLTIIDKAAQIILNTGLEELTIHNLAKELNLDENYLLQQFGSVDVILVMLLESFEHELREFIKEISGKEEGPETTFKLLFKRLYFLFLQRPYYLAVIFNKSLTQKNEKITAVVFRIKKLAKSYLIGIIEEGKRQQVFKTPLPSEKWADRILAEFRLFMENEQRVNELVINMKSTQNE